MVNLLETEQTSKPNIKRGKGTQTTFGELPLTGVLPSRDSEIRVAIARIGKTNHCNPQTSRK